jgi:hypothetical protein
MCTLAGAQHSQCLFFLAIVGLFSKTAPVFPENGAIAITTSIDCSQMILHAMTLQSVCNERWKLQIMTDGFYKSMNRQNTAEIWTHHTKWWLVAKVKQANFDF